MQCSLKIYNVWNNWWKQKQNIFPRKFPKISPKQASCAVSIPCFSTDALRQPQDSSIWIYPRTLRRANRAKKIRRRWCEKTTLEFTFRIFHSIPRTLSPQHREICWSLSSNHVLPLDHQCSEQRSEMEWTYRTIENSKNQ